MSPGAFSRALRGLVGALAMCASASAVQAQQGSIAVKVTEAGKDRPVEAAQVFLAGTTVGGLTNSEGRVTLRGVVAGQHIIRVLRVGFSEKKTPVTVVAGQQATVDIEIEAAVVSLAPVVTTATGDQRRVEVGNAVTAINAVKAVETVPISSVDNLLTARAPSMAVTTGTQTGSGSRMRIRGQSSLNLSNEPLFIIDGVRMTSNANSSNLFTGGAQPSRIGDINPEEIENIEVIKGPSAASLYGTQAANGVVVITTKRGRAGAARWTTYAEGGLIQDRNTYPFAYTMFGKVNATDANEAAFNFCYNQRVGVGQCKVVDSIAALNVFANDSLTPLGTGNRQQYGAQLSGGTDQIRYFLSAEHENEIGIMQLPTFERNRLNKEKAPIHDWTDRPNALAKNSFRMNLNSAITPKLDLSLSSNFINLDQRFSLESNATAGLGSQVFGGPGCIVCNPNRVVQAQSGQPALNSPLYGYRAWTPGYSWQEKNQQRVNRTILAGNANWRPLGWLQNTFTMGNDFTDRVDDNFLANGEGPPITATYRNGFKANTRADLRNTTLGSVHTGTFTYKPWVIFKTSVGLQYVNTLTQLNVANGLELPPGAQTPNGAVTRTAQEATTVIKTLGAYVEEAAALNDRLFLTVGVRSDQNSAFGTNFQRVYYPKFSASWIVSDEDFFPKMGWLNQLRLRSAYGSSGVQPGPNDALAFFGTNLASVRGTDLSGLQINAIGNPSLRPERSTEAEGGFEARLFNSRATLDLTYYNKKTKDALISAIVAPSVGSANSVRKNLGAVKNWGWEISSTMQLVDRSSLGLDLAVNYSTNSNELLSLGGTPPQINVETRVVEGYPLFGFWENKILGWKDKNADGLITYWADTAKNEIFVDTVDTFRGYTQPRNLLTVTTGLDLLNRKLRVQGLLDYRGGHRWYNNTERIRCTRPNCAGKMSNTATLEDQAMVVAAQEHPARTLDGYFQPGAFWRFRELSLQYTLANDLARKIFRGQSANIVASARNLGLWTKYRGVDPEADYQATVDNNVPSEFQTLGAPSYFVFRINVVY